MGLATLSFKLTVVSMHVLSLTAPQHPKNAMTKTMLPTIMRSVGANSNESGITLLASLTLSLYRTPTMSSAKPASCNINIIN